MSNAIVIHNKFAGKCRVCGKRVQALEGLAIKDVHQWQVAHFHCEDALAAPILAAQEAKRAEYKKQEEARQAALEAKKLRRAELLVKTGLNLDAPEQLSHAMYSYSDVYQTAYPYTGTGTLEEFRELLEAPAESGWGKLRWSGGVSVVSVEEGRVTVSESVSMCD